MPNKTLPPYENWWDKISEYENDFPEGYTDGKECICPACYEKHILPREKAI